MQDAGRAPASATSHSGGAGEEHEDRQDGPFAVEVVLVGIRRQDGQFLPYLRPPFKRSGLRRRWQRRWMWLGLAADAAMEPARNDVAESIPCLVIAIAADAIGKGMHGCDVNVGQPRGECAKRAIKRQPL